MRVWNEQHLSVAGIGGLQISWGSATGHSEAPMVTPKFQDPLVTPPRFG